MAERALRMLLVKSWVEDPLPVLAAIEAGGLAIGSRWERVDHPASLAAAIERDGWDLVLYDNATREVRLEQVLDALREHGHQVPVVVIGKLEELATEIELALRAAAANFG